MVTDEQIEAAWEAWNAAGPFGDMRAALEAAERVAWCDDMGKAPRDKPLLGVVHGAMRVIQWGKTSHVPLYGWCLADQGVEDFDICNPTAWHPLPEPPHD